jgi:hypothetical protein
MIKRSKITKLGFAALVGGCAITTVSLSEANAARHYYPQYSVESQVPSQYQSGPYHEDRLPDGTLTGPIAPDANGG